MARVIVILVEDPQPGLVEAIKRTIREYEDLPTGTPHAADEPMVGYLEFRAFCMGLIGTAGQRQGWALRGWDALLSMLPHDALYCVTCHKQYGVCNCNNGEPYYAESRNRWRIRVRTLKDLPEGAFHTIHPNTLPRLQGFIASL